MENIYTMDEAWRAYYSELEPIKRVQIYAEHVGAEAPGKKASAIRSMRGIEPAADVDRLRKELFLQRHVGPKDREMDQVMAVMMEFMNLSRNRFHLPARDVHRGLESLGFELADQAGDAGRSLLYWELRNGAARYLSTCTGADYGRAFFGLMAASEEQQNARTTADIWNCTRRIEHLAGDALTAEDAGRLQLYEQAVVDAFYAFHEDARDWFETYEGNH